MVWGWVLGWWGVGGMVSVGMEVVSVSFPASLNQKCECDLQFQAI